MSEKTNKELITQCRIRLSEPMLYSSGRMASDVKELAERLAKKEKDWEALRGWLLEEQTEFENLDSNGVHLPLARYSLLCETKNKMAEIEAEVDEMLE